MRIGSKKDEGEDKKVKESGKGDEEDKTATYGCRFQVLFVPRSEKGNQV